MGGGLYGGRSIGKWLASRISWLGKRYDDRKTHENRLKKKVLCRKARIVITSL